MFSGRQMGDIPPLRCNRNNKKKAWSIGQGFLFYYLLCPSSEFARHPASFFLHCPIINSEGAGFALMFTNALPKCRAMPHASSVARSLESICQHMLCPPYALSARAILSLPCRGVWGFAPVLKTAFDLPRLNTRDAKALLPALPHHDSSGVWGPCPHV